MSVARQGQRLMTAEDLWEMPEVPGKRFELVEGDIVEAPGAGMLHNLNVGLIYKLIDTYVQEQHLGLVFTDGTGYVLRRQPDVVRIPDVSFVSWERLPEGDVPEGYGTGSPDLAVEIVSPGDRAEEVHDNVLGYLDAGTQMVWVLWPKRQSVTVYESGRVGRELGPDDVLQGGEVLPNFQATVKELFEVRRTR